MATGTWAQFSSPTDNSPLQAFSKSPNGMSPIGSNHFSGPASLPPPVSNSMKIAPIGKDPNRTNHSDQQLLSNSNSSFGIASSSPGTMSSFGPSTSTVSNIGTLTGPQFLWGSPKPYSEHSQSSSWQSPPMGQSFSSNVHSQGQNFLYGNRQTAFHHLVGSAPSGVPFDSNFGYFPESPEAPFMSQANFGNRNGGGLMMNVGARANMNLGTNLPDNNSPNFRMMQSQRLGQTLFGNAPYPGLGSIGFEGLAERARGRRVDNNGNQADSKKQYQLNLEKIVNGEDTRTTLMIKNIPNKYDQLNIYI